MASAADTPAAHSSRKDGRRADAASLPPELWSSVLDFLPLGEVLDAQQCSRSLSTASLLPTLSCFRELTLLQRAELGALRAQDALQVGQL